MTDLCSEDRMNNEGTVGDQIETSIQQPTASRDHLPREGKLVERIATVKYTGAGLVS
jgi:hypothetical protein